MNIPNRYSIDRVGDSEWAIFDGAKRGTPIVYALYVIQTVGMLNHQLILTSYDGISAAETMVPVFEVELYSMFFYSIPEGVETMIHNIFSVLLTSDIDNPVELAYFFGGTVRSGPVRQDRKQISH